MKKCLEQERLQKQKQDEELQKHLFEEARRRAMQDPHLKQLRQPSFPINGPSISLIDYYRKMDYEIEILAKKYTSEFMSSKEFAGECNYQQILQVYKIIIMPEEILKNYM